MVLLIILSFTFTFGDTIIDKDLTYEEALTLAIESSNTLETIDDKILLAERLFKSANNKSDSVKTSGIVSDSELLENGKIKAYYPSQEKRNLIDLKEERNNVIKDLEVEVLEKYNTVKNTKESLQFKKTDLQIAKEEYEQMQIKYELGMIIENELFEYEIAVNTIQSDINSLEREYRKALIDLNRVIGYPIDTELNIGMKVDISLDSLEYDMRTIVEKAKENSKIVRDAYNDYLLKDLERVVINRYSRYEKPDSYDDLEEEVLDLKELYDDAKIDAAVSFYTDYYNLLNSEADVLIAQLNMQLLNRKYEIEKVKFDNEMTVYLDYKKAIYDYRDAYKDYNNKQLKLYKAKTLFDYKIEKLDTIYESAIVK